MHATKNISQGNWKLACALIALTANWYGCIQQGPPRGSASATVSSASDTTADQLPQPEGPAPEINGAKAMQYVREVVNCGPRPPGSPGHKKIEAYLRAKLRMDHLQEDSFSASTPAGAIPMRNFIAQFSGAKDGIIVLAGHYDTRNTPKDFVGANDGGSSTAILLAIADQLRGKKRQGYSVWLVWLDGEEALQQWSATDSVYGSRHLAEKWRGDGTAAKLKAFLLADMVGDADLNIERDQNSTPWLEDVVHHAASQLGYQSHFFARRVAIDDDHIPFSKIGVPVADLIDFDYGYNNVFWHTSADTLDKLSPQSFVVVGDVLLRTVQLLDIRK